MGRGDFDVIGRQWVDYFVAHCALKPEESVLDVGSGIGRVAIPMTDYLTGRYEGLDVVREGVEWCSEHDHPGLPELPLSASPTSTTGYTTRTASQHPAGVPLSLRGRRVRLRVPDLRVHAHASAGGRALHRRDRDGCCDQDGRCLASVFLWDESVEPSQPQLRFDDDAGPYRFNHGFKPEDVLGIQGGVPARLLQRCGFSPTVDYGWWGRPAGETNLDAQDIVLARLGPEQR